MPLLNLLASPLLLRLHSRPMSAHRWQCLGVPPPFLFSMTGTSFTALLGLASNHSLDFLHETLASPVGCCSLIFPADVKLVERVARLSVISGEESPEVSNSGEISPAKIKTEMKGRAVGNTRKGSDKSKITYGEILLILYGDTKNIWRMELPSMATSSRSVGSSSYQLLCISMGVKWAL